MATLTEKQLKRTIAHKISTAKPILVCPDVIYWPLIEDEKCIVFEDLLKRYTTELGFVKSEAKVTKKTAQPKVSIPDNVREHFRIGVNSTIRSLQAHKAQCLLISDDISPKFLGKHIICMALNRNPDITIAVITNLSSIFKNVFGISCCICAGQNFPDDLKVFLQKSTKKYEKPVQFQLKSSQSDNQTPKKRPTEPPVDFEKVYLKKPSGGGRAFEPATKLKLVKPVSKPEWNDYITFNDVSSGSDEKMETDEVSDIEKIESTVIQLKDLNLPSVTKLSDGLEPKKKKKRKKTKPDKAGIQYSPAVARKIYGNPQKKKKKKNKN